MVSNCLYTERFYIMIVMFDNHVVYHMDFYHNFQIGQNRYDLIIILLLFYLK